MLINNCDGVDCGSTVGVNRGNRKLVIHEEVDMIKWYLCGLNVI